jgi:tRNA pseudouridine55 synthase
MHGLILVDKPRGATSHDVVDRVRRILGQQRVGHFGTLDPLATGLLLVAVGGATRLFPWFSRHDKVYSGEMRLGWATDTYDSQGKPASEESADFPDRSTLLEAMKGFVGRIEQAPPPYSAKKVEGKPLYKWARSKREIRPKACPVVVHAFDLENYAPPLAKFSVRCGAGTYIRSLVHDLGRALGCGAHLAGLRRLAVGIYGLDKALSLEEIERLAKEGRWESVLVPLEALLPDCPKAVLTEAGCRRLQKGRPLPEDFVLEVIPAVREGASVEEHPQVCRLFSPEGRFLGLAEPVQGGKTLLPLLIL